MSRTLRHIASSSAMRSMAATSQHNKVAVGELDVHSTGYSLNGDHIRYHILITSLCASRGSTVLREKPVLKVHKVIRRHSIDLWLWPLILTNPSND